MGVIQKFEIKQITPIIHFQYDEPGACIRASELKPKFDIYLHEKYQGIIKKNWLIGSTEALNYKVKICPSSPQDFKISEQGDYITKIKSTRDKDEKRNINQRYRDKLINKMYFGNMGDSGEFKEAILYNKPIEVTFTCMIPELQKMIKDSFAEFLYVTNFATRQSKSFGGFVEKSCTAQDALAFYKKQNYKYFYAKCPKSTVDEQMEVAATIYSCMKGGINMSKIKKDEKAYIKGYIQRDFLDEKIGSDKAFIKSNILISGNDMDDIEQKYEEYEFVRALLGLAEGYEFRDDNRKGKIVIESSNGVKRFESPITIKIIDDFIFFIFNESYREMLGKEFRFSTKEVKVGKGKVASIKVPASFDVDSFITGFVDYFNDNDTKERLLACGYPFSLAGKTKIEKGSVKE